MTSVRASAPTTFYPCRMNLPCTQCPIRTQCAGKPLLAARPICEDGHRIVTRDFLGRVDL